MKNYFFAALMLMSLNASAEMVKWVDENGKVHFSDKAPEHVQSQSVKLGNGNFVSKNALEKKSTPTSTNSSSVEQQRRKVQDAFAQQKKDYYKKMKDTKPSMGYVYEQNEKSKKDLERIGKQHKKQHPEGPEAIAHSREVIRQSGICDQKGYKNHPGCQSIND